MYNTQNNRTKDHFRVPKTLTLKRGQVQNLSCETKFYLHDNKKSFTQERFCTWPRFKTEACVISEMAYWSQQLVNIDQ